MVTQTDLIISIVIAVFGSTGFWALITYLIQRRDTKESAESQMLKGLAHDRICSLGNDYLRQGYITPADYQNIHDYLFVPYKRLGGNGTADKIMREVSDLPMRDEYGKAS